MRYNGGVKGFLENCTLFLQNFNDKLVNELKFAKNKILKYFYV